ncbi:hypothetical protein ACMFMG_006878 [Clarireedia jacksonii]
MANLYEKISTLEMPLVIQDSRIPVGEWPWGHQFSWSSDDNIIRGHRYRKRSENCPNIKNSSQKRTAMLLNSLRGICAGLPPGIFVKASSERFDILINEHFPASPPLVAFAQEDSQDMISWERINPGMKTDYDGNLVALNAWCSEKVGFHQVFELLRSEVIGRKYSFNRAFVQVNQFKTFIHAILFWLTHEIHLWRKITQLYWRSFGLQVIDIISRWFATNPLLQSLQAKSMGLGCRLITDLPREDVLIQLYGHLKSDFWSHTIEKARVVNKGSPACEAEEMDSEDVNLRNAGALGQKIDASKGDILSKVHHLIHSKFWINSRLIRKMVLHSGPAQPGTLWWAERKPALISAAPQNSILPSLPLLFEELSHECQDFMIACIPRRGEFYAWLEKADNSDNDDIDRTGNSTGLEPWNSPKLEENTGGGERFGGGVGADEKSDLLKMKEEWSEVSEDAQKWNATDGCDDLSDYGIGLGMEQDDGQHGWDENDENNEYWDDAEGEENGRYNGYEIELSARMDRYRAHTL